MAADASITDRRARIRTWLVWGTIQALLIAGVAFVGMGGRARSFRVPLDFSSDTLVFLAQAKSTVDNGWWWVNPRIGAPASFQALLLPSNSNVDEAIVWMVSRVVRSFPLNVNLSWVGMLILSGFSATYCLRGLGASRAASLAAGTLFALSPYALYRQIGHFSLVTYLVPFPAALALQLACGRVERGWRAVPLLAGCALLGFNYVYYAFFASFFMIVAGLSGYLGSGNVRVLRRASLALVIIVGCVVLNFAPSWYVAHREGDPLLVRQKTAAEGELYGLKIRHLISPVYHHSFPLFREWTEKEIAAAFPLENENTSSRLGLVASLGFIGLLGSTLLWVGRRRPRPLVIAAGQLTIAALLLSTVGGFGSLFNLLVAPDIRGYNRICPFIAVFALVAVAAALDGIGRRRRAAVLAAAVTVIGVWDQSQALQAIASNAGAITTEYLSIREFVTRLEAALPRGAAVLQLPFTVYLSDTGRLRMRTYDQFKPYLVSKDSRWSYPALSNAQFAWQEGASQLPPSELAAFAAEEGFSAILIDRYGYFDAGAALVASLSAVPGATVLVTDDRYIALDIQHVDRSPALLTPDRLAEIRTDRPTTSRLPVCGAVPPLNIDRIGPVVLPDIAAPVRLPASSNVTISGWATAPLTDQAGVDVELSLDGIVYPAAYGFDRPDVAVHLQTGTAQASGFIAVLPIGGLSAGAHVLTVRVIARGGSCFYQGRPIALVKP